MILFKCKHTHTHTHTHTCTHIKTHTHSHFPGEELLKYLIFHFNFTLYIHIQFNSNMLFSLECFLFSFFLLAGHTPIFEKSLRVQFQKSTLENKYQFYLCGCGRVRAACSGGAWRGGGIAEDFLRSDPVGLAAPVTFPAG